ncbi:hypothetical protein AB0L40_06960 [Patulibacter sp. NPDC049589]|uniref:hypothetical protein n=1 Tax=Patulibacter sp. NPDC049589 TaxID=3154731 RepID=UPI00342672D8
MGSSDIPSGDDAEIRRIEREREANRPLEEAGEGESEGFELAEAELIDHASHGDQHGTGVITRDARTGEDLDGAPDDERYGEADDEETVDLGQDSAADADG